MSLDVDGVDDSDPAFTAALLANDLQSYSFDLGALRRWMVALYAAPPPPCPPHPTPPARLLISRSPAVLSATLISMVVKTRTVTYIKVVADPRFFFLLSFFLFLFFVLSFLCSWRRSGIYVPVYKPFPDRHSDYLLQQVCT